MPRLLDQTHCPHCAVELPDPPKDADEAELAANNPRVCPECGGSLQQRYLRAGCFSSAPPLYLAAWALWKLLSQ